MNNTAALVLSTKNVRTALLDIFALLFIYFTPAISHLISLPLYLLEPMRIMLVLSVAHTSRKNAYLIAFTLPLFSFIISSHPSVIKSLLITSELLLNVWLFFYLSEKVKNIFGAAIASILISKVFYYLLKFFCISSGLIVSELISTPLWIQAVVTLVLSGYIYYMLSKK